MKKTRTRKWFFADHPELCDLPCEHGHLSCSFRDGGPCGDEWLSNHEAGAETEQAAPELAKLFPIG